MTTFPRSLGKTNYVKGNHSKIMFCHMKIHVVDMIFQLGRPGFIGFEPMFIDFRGCSTFLLLIYYMYNGYGYGYGCDYG